MVDRSASSGPAPRGWTGLDGSLGTPVRAGFTTRQGGRSRGSWGDGAGGGGLNLGAHCGDDPQHVAANRALLRSVLPGEPCWLDQVHGTEVLELTEPLGAPARADAAVTTRPGVVLAVLTADCLPVLMTDVDGKVVGAAHAGWRGLAAGVLENTVAAARALAPGARGWRAWLGPAIGQAAFEVGDDVRQAFMQADPQAAACFAVGLSPGKWQADLVGLARRRLSRAGIDRVAIEPVCTHRDAGRFYSYRRDGATGRMGSFIWIDPPA